MSLCGKPCPQCVDGIQACNTAAFVGHRSQFQSALSWQGRVACEINSGDELVATEVIFAGVLAELEPEEAVALLSALVFQASP